MRVSASASKIIRSIARVEYPNYSGIRQCSLQNCELGIELAQSLNIELLYLTAYSPNLNLIERLWKFVKKQCPYSVYYADFNGFKAAITACLSQCHTTYKRELDSLLTLRFQSFKKTKPVP